MFRYILCTLINTWKIIVCTEMGENVRFWLRHASNQGIVYTVFYLKCNIVSSVSIISNVDIKRNTYNTGTADTLYSSCLATCHQWNSRQSQYKITKVNKPCITKSVNIQNATFHWWLRIQWMYITTCNWLT